MDDLLEEKCTAEVHFYWRGGLVHKLIVTQCGYDVDREVVD